MIIYIFPVGGKSLFSCASPLSLFVIRNRHTQTRFLHRNTTQNTQFRIEEKRKQKRQPSSLSVSVAQSHVLCEVAYRWSKLRWRSEVDEAVVVRSCGWGRLTVLACVQICQFLADFDAGIA